MHITAIKTELKDKSNIWKFFPGIGEFSNSWAIQASGGERENLYDSINFVLKNADSSNIIRSEVLVADSDGEIWSVTKDQMGRYFSYQGKQVEEKEFFASFGVDPEDGELQVLNHHIWQKGNVSYCKSTGFPKGGERARKELGRVVKKLVASKLQRYALSDLDPVDVDHIGPKIIQLASLRERYLHLQQMIKEGSESSIKNISDAHLLDDLKKQLSLIDQIADTLKHFYDDGVDLNRLKEEKQGIEQQVSDLVARANIPSLPSLEDSPDWESIISTMVRKRTLERFAQSTMATERAFNQHTVPVFKEHVETIRELIGGDLSEIEELATSLDLVRVEYDKLLAEMNESQEESSWDQYKKRLSGTFAKLSKGEATTSLSKQDQLKEKAEKSLERLTNLRFSIEQVLYKGRDIRSALESTPGQYNESLDSIRSIYEKSAGDLEKVKADWDKLCKKYNLPDNLNLRQLDLIVRDYTSVINHRRKITEINNKIAHQKSHLRDLVLYLKQWSDINQSQKIVKYDSPSSIVTEAKRVLQYKREKEKRLSQINDDGENQKALVKHRKILRTDLEQIKIEWDEIFAKTGLHPIEPNSSEFAAILAEVNQVIALEEIEAAMTKRGKANLLDDVIDSGAKLNIWRVLETEAGSISPGSLMNIVEKNKNLSAHIYLLGAKTELEALRANGLGVIVGSTRAQTAAPKVAKQSKVARKSVGAKPAPKPAQVNSNALLDERAKHVLDILNTKR